MPRFLLTSWHRLWYILTVAKRTAPKPLVLKGELPLEFELNEVSGEWRLEGESLHWQEQPDSIGAWPRNEGATELRRQFLSIERDDVEALLNFLNRTGLWDKYRKEYPLYEFWQEQDTIRILLTGRTLDYWLQSAIERFFRNFLDELVPDQFEFQGKKPVMTYILAETQAALFLSAWLDFARGARFRFCARSDCPTHRKDTVPFELTSRRRRRYCSQYCAHLESMRRNRAQTKTKKGRKT